MNYGEILDGRESDFVTLTPGKLAVGDVFVSFDGWFVRGHVIDKIKKVRTASGTEYQLHLASSKSGYGRTITVHANGRVEVIKMQRS